MRAAGAILSTRSIGAAAREFEHFAVAASDASRAATAAHAQPARLLARKRRLR
jgi:hypothetical protein